MTFSRSPKASELEDGAEGTDKDQQLTPTSGKRGGREIYIYPTNRVTIGKMDVEVRELKFWEDLLGMILE